MSKQTIPSNKSLHEDFIKVPKTIRAIDEEKAAELDIEISNLVETSAPLIGKTLNNHKQTKVFISAACSLSGYFRSLVLVHPDDFITLLEKGYDETFSFLTNAAANAWNTSSDQNELMSVLRSHKRQMALALGLADLGGWINAQKVTHLLTEFADACLSATVNFLLLDLHKRKKIELVDQSHPSVSSGLIILAMGKYGAHELNYSSDIDIIIFFDDECEMKILADDATSLFSRFAKDLNKILQERTGDGYVFRVDLRLRPDPGSTPLALPLGAAFNYYEAYGQNWERAAFIKARASAGDINAGNSFLQELTPFIWRKHLDFASISDVHSIKRQIHAHKGHGKIAVHGHNVKLGRGGIREIEFFVQTQQLIAGGRMPALRSISTIGALSVLAEHGWIEESDAKALGAAYWYLRDIEHRIQMVADEQSHLLPSTDEELWRIGLMMGAESLEGFIAKLVETMKLVETHYAALFEASPELTGQGGNLVFTGDDDDPETLETLSALGFNQPSQIIATIRGWHYGRLRAISNAQARELLTELTPALIEAFAQTTQPDKSFFAFERFLSGLPAGIQLFSILKSNPNLLYLLTSILGSSPRLAQIITQRPNVFDGLISPSFGPSVPTNEEWSEMLSLMLEQASDYEAKLDQLRIFNTEQKFLISIRFLNKTIDVFQLGVAFSDLAEIVMAQLLEVVRKEFEKKHGKIEGSELAILGMGRLGSKELTAGSDLDLIFLYKVEDDQALSTGPKPLYATQYYMRLVQRLITATSAPTANGVLYELDFRLRPSGNSGPLATQLDSFVNYQKKEAWVWEHQALVRARAICGDDRLISEVEKEITLILSSPKDRKNITSEILKMRKLLDEERPAINEFDVKNAKGGLIDIEFIAQWGVLVNGDFASLGPEIGTLKIIEQLPDSLISTSQKQELKAGFELFAKVLHLLRINLVDDVDPTDFSKELVNKLTEATDLPDLSTLRATLKDVHVGIRNTFSTLLGT